MRILIGGSPSTGSSVFRQILNRHPEIFCGPETNLFCYPELYEHWRRSRMRILLPQRLSLTKADVRVIRGVQLEDNEFGWTNRELKKLLLSHHTFTGFCDAFFSRPLERYHKQHWAEKSPANAFQFPGFMRAFEDAYLIHTVRCPYDTVTSLVSRGMSTYQAASVYLLYTAHGLAAQNMPGYIEARYESLVKDAAQTMNEKILQPLSLRYTNEMLNTGNPNMTGTSRMPGWQMDELDNVSDLSLSRYLSCSPETQTAIATALASVRITADYVKRNHLEQATIENICSALNYHFHTEPERLNHNLVPALQQDRKQSMRQLWWYRLLSSFRYSYPIDLDPRFMIRN